MPFTFHLCAHQKTSINMLIQQAREKKVQAQQPCQTCDHHSLLDISAPLNAHATHDNPQALLHQLSPL